MFVYFDDKLIEINVASETQLKSHDIDFDPGIMIHNKNVLVMMNE
jgi:hypothetical protein